ncbi:NAD+ diphosphatase [Salinihabitans flavidus]|uniref:NAD(+) diphosphatase n=1 Tax=Salinihabitans flavidus TaxID=569882 RepID=A0A1H8V4F3_9RHOB|nr:NAD(+) diphosphatase [Salinihabitans flavidus]SEP10309.1 NAD+ diphosphatase [Salinihabitans flavidus]
MRHAETVTFGGSAFDRAADLRADAETLARLAQAPQTRTVLLWRGKPLVTGAGRDALLRVPMDHPVPATARQAPILLGREEGRLIFAHDISDWEPEGVDLSGVGGFTDPSEQIHPDLPKGAVFCELRRIMAGLSPRDAELAGTAKAVLGWHVSHRFCAVCGRESAAVMAGWQRVCRSCGAHHFPRTDPVVIMLILHGNSVLMGRSHGWPEGMYSLLAGFVEPGETLEAAVRREVAEEARIAVGTVAYLASQPWGFPSSLMIGCRGVAQSAEIVVDPVELDDARWISREEMMAAFAGQNPDLKPARKGSIAQFILRNWLADRLD